VVEPQENEAALFPERVGDRLRVARTKAGLDLSDIATKTRIPLRHLQSIETGDYSAFPSPTYCVGFVKAYARAVGADEVVLARDLRVELGDVRQDTRHEYYDAEDADPARLPSRTLAWTAAAILLLFLIGYGIWRTQMMSGGDTSSSEVSTPADVPTVPVQPTAQPAPPNPTGQVALTARGPVWIRVYDKANKVLFEKEMAAGETYAVPANADQPQIRTGGAERIAVTIDGREVAPLGAPERTIKDVGVSATALTARAPTPAPPPSGNSTGVATPPTPQP
jgi:cytoskeleton protein RodZ